MLESGANIAACGDYGETALLLRYLPRGHNDAAISLLESSANIEAVLADGNTALNCAAKARLSDLVIALLKSGSDIAARNKKGTRALLEHYFRSVNKDAMMVLILAKIELAAVISLGDSWQDL